MNAAQLFYRVMFPTPKKRIKGCGVILFASDLYISSTVSENQEEIDLDLLNEQLLELEDVNPHLVRWICHIQEVLITQISQQAEQIEFLQQDLLLKEQQILVLEELQTASHGTNFDDINDPELKMHIFDSYTMKRETLSMLPFDFEDLSDQVNEIKSIRLKLSGKKSEAQIEKIQHFLVIKDKHGISGMTVRDIGKLLGVSKERARKIVLEMERRRLVNRIWDPHDTRRQLVLIVKRISN